MCFSLPHFTISKTAGLRHFHLSFCLLCHKIAQVNIFQHSNTFLFQEIGFARTLGSPSKGGCVSPELQASFFSCQQEEESGQHQELEVACPCCLSPLPLVFSFSCKFLQIILTPTPTSYPQHSPRCSKYPAVLRASDFHLDNNPGVYLCSKLSVSGRACLLPFHFFFHREKTWIVIIIIIIAFKTPLVSK